MSSYYFVTTSLPALRLGDPADISFNEFIELVEENLTPEDMRLIRRVQRMFDLQNLAAYWRGQELDPWGSLTKVGIEDAIGLGVNVPDYVLQFLSDYESNEERLHHHGRLMAEFFQTEISRSTGFLKEYLQFEREWRVVMVGLRANRLGRDVAKELQYEDADDVIVAQVLAQKDAKSFEPPEGYEGLRPIIADHGDEPKQLYQELERYRYARVEELMEGEMFSMAFVLGYMVELMIVEKWQEINERSSRVA